MAFGAACDPGRTRHKQTASRWPPAEILAFCGAPTMRLVLRTGLRRPKSLPMILSCGDLARSFVAPDAEPQSVECGEVNQRQYRRNSDATHESRGHGTKEVTPQQRNESQYRRRRGQCNRAEPSHRRADARLVPRVSRTNVLLDLVDQDDRVAHDDSKHGDRSQQRHDAKWLAEQQQRQNDVYESEVRG